MAGAAPDETGPAVESASAASVPSPDAPTPPPERKKATLTGAQETLLAALYARALDTEKAKPVLGDTWAAEAVRRIDYDFAGKTGINATSSASVTVRAKVLDRWTAEFLGRMDGRPATVLHLGCGLDSRRRRVPRAAAGAGAGGEVRWVDVDLPDAVALRREVLEEPEGDYTLLAASVAELEAGSWLERVPADRPTVVVFEGLSMYLTEEQGRRLIERLVGRFKGCGGGQLLFDAFGTIGIKLQRFLKAVAQSGAELHWGLDDPKVLEGWCEGLRLLDDLLSVDLIEEADYPSSTKLMIWLMGYLIWPLRKTGRILRYEF